jgi:hypothetical protein
LKRHGGRYRSGRPLLRDKFGSAGGAPSTGAPFLHDLTPLIEQLDCNEQDAHVGPALGDAHVVDTELDCNVSPMRIGRLNFQVQPSATPSMKNADCTLMPSVSDGPIDPCAMRPPNSVVFA